ncbi:MAG: DM13 domain-containing protein [Thaumarchaeota archaeon]|nr:DM13 domain-containing protein [Nitrososphaerota archaeon]
MTYISKKQLILILAVLIVTPVVSLLAGPLVFSKTIDEEIEEKTSFETLSQGIFKGADSFHKASGSAYIFQSTNGSRFLRLESFQTTNGPDLYIYLASDIEASGFVNLGRLKANIGNQTYTIPSDVDISNYEYTLVWCKAFSVLFGSAKLN